MFAKLLLLLIPLSYLPTTQRQEGRSIICSTFSKVKPVFFIQTSIKNLFPSFISLLSVECNASDPIPKSRPAFSQIATSVTEHHLPPAMREFKTSQSSTVHPASTSLPHLTTLFLWRWKVSFPSSTFNFACSLVQLLLMNSELL
ncbi:hypothetical protein AVEN_110659-1 [Araneus ventricosus]|uniref:Secreted protein n=1 Tax=Araneus ventricosus TaxID=182803 RepID=A0A4Y2AW04_ARAVE|nr:hypothetical protein AVEN_110659-1 [Araneus ventricosus]